ncbi:MAG: nitroreductase [Candidatus Melainabacteria bacterium HGW-Melainabacteria-1]|nr:MAG: nitroreductase [Candidatus Melainabacteria bacterium HGW-Melainabacteria-1]
MNMHELITSRRTTFQFQDQPVPEEVLRRALEAARWAPNHKMTQPWRFVLVGPETSGRLKAYAVRRLAEKLSSKGLSEDEIAERMRQPQPVIPCQILVYALRSPDPGRAKEDYAATCCAVQNLMLAAWADGVASGWKSFDKAEGYQLFGLDPALTQIVGLLQLGYPLKARSSQRQPLESFIETRP